MLDNLQKKVKNFNKIFGSHLNALDDDNFTNSKRISVLEQISQYQRQDLEHHKMQKIKEIDNLKQRTRGLGEFKSSIEKKLNMVKIQSETVEENCNEHVSEMIATLEQVKDPLLNEIANLQS